jgi:hypothetical protein
MKRVLQTVDHKCANMLKEAGPLPYYALSSLLTAFSHDVPTFPLIQHVFDYVLPRLPIVLIYLTAAVRPSAVSILYTYVLADPPDEMSTLLQTGDRGMLHMVLSTLPVFEDEVVTPPRRADNAGLRPTQQRGRRLHVHSDALEGHGEGTPEG